MTYQEKIQAVIEGLQDGGDTEEEWAESILCRIGINRPSKATTKREKFLKTTWKIAWDGLWENPAADPNCEVCNGRGILDDGHYAPIFINCTECWKNEE